MQDGEWQCRHRAWELGFSNGCRCGGCGTEWNPLWRVSFLPRRQQPPTTAHSREEQRQSLHLTFMKVYAPQIRLNTIQSQQGILGKPGHLPLCAGSGFYSVTARGPLNAGSCIKPSETLRPGCSSQAPQECKKISLRLSETFL